MITLESLEDVHAKQHLGGLCNGDREDVNIPGCVQPGGQGRYLAHCKPGQDGEYNVEQVLS